MGFLSTATVLVTLITRSSGLRPSSSTNPVSKNVEGKPFLPYGLRARSTACRMSTLILKAKPGWSFLGRGLIISESLSPRKAAPSKMLSFSSSEFTSSPGIMSPPTSLRLAAKRPTVMAWPSRSLRNLRDSFMPSFDISVSLILWGSRFNSHSPMSLAYPFRRRSSESWLLASGLSLLSITTKAEIYKYK